MFNPGSLGSTFGMHVPSDFIIMYTCNVGVVHGDGLYRGPASVDSGVNITTGCNYDYYYRTL